MSKPSSEQPTLASGVSPVSESATLAHVAPSPDSATLAASDQVASGSEVAFVPGYELLGELGRGGMGVVYKARHTKLHRLVALKMILAGGHAGAADRVRFQTEAEAIARLQHPNIVQVHEVGEHEGKPFFSLEFCGGGSLAQKLNGTPLPALEAAALVETLARAMQAAHEHQIIHRDLKPANVLLTEDGSPKITDFGLAKKLDEVGQTQEGAIMGTPSYMAPEQAGGKSTELGPLADVYALGAILYECLTGRPPFKAATALDTIMQVMKDEPVPPSQLQTKTPRDLETICLKCLHKEPARRYQTANQFADDLKRFLDDRPILARRASSFERLARWRRRNPVVAALTLTVAVVLLAGVAVSTYFAVDAQQRAGEAERSSQAAKTAQRTAENAVEESRKRLVRLHLASGNNRIDQGDPVAALLWYQRAWEMDQVDPDQEAGHRLRVAALLECLPRLEGVCFHTSRVEDALFDPSGQLVLTRDETAAHLWNPYESRCIASFSHEGGVLHAAFSPDGAAVVTTGKDGTAQLWKTADGQRLLPPLAHPAAVLHAAFSPDGLTLATGCADKKVYFWKVRDGSAQPLKLACGGGVWHVGFSSDGKQLATADDTNNVRVWDVANGQPVTATLAHENDPEVRRLTPVFSPDGTQLATFARLGVSFWNLASGAKVRTLNYPQFSFPKQMAFNPNGTRFVVLGTTAASLYDAKTGTIRAQLLHPRETAFGDFSPDGRLLATTSSGGRIHLWDATGKELLPPFRQSGQVHRVQFSPDGQRLLVAGTDGTARIWRVVFTPADVRPHDLSCGHADLIRPFRGSEGGFAATPTGLSCCYSPDGRREVRFGNAVTACLAWRDGDHGNQEIVLDHGETVQFAAFSPDGRRLLTAGAARLSVWDAESNQLAGPAISLKGPLHQAWFSNDGGRLLTVTAAEVCVWDTATGKSLLGPLTFAPGALGTFTIYRPGISPDGRHIVLAGGGDMQVKAYDVDSGRVVTPSPGHSGGAMWSAEFSADSRRILSAGSDATARLWDAETGQALGPPLRHPTFVRDAALAPDGRRAVTIDAVKKVRLWNAETGDLLVPPFTLSMSSNAHLWFSADSRRVIALDITGKTMQWTLPTFDLPLRHVAPFMKLLTSQYIDERDGLDDVPETEFREHNELYRETWQAWRRACGASNLKE